VLLRHSCISCSFDLWKLEGNTPFTPWCHQSIETHSQSCHIAFECFIDQFTRNTFGLAFEKGLGGQGCVVT
jgi:hypothetical protein